MRLFSVQAKAPGNSLKKLAKYFVTLVRSNRKNDSLNNVVRFCVLPLFRISDLSASKRLALFSFKFVPSFCAKPGMILFTFF